MPVMMLSVYLTVTPPPAPPAPSSPALPLALVLSASLGGALVLALLTALLALHWHRTRRAKKASAVLSAVGASEALLPAEALNTAPVFEDYQLADDGPGGRGFPDRKASLERLSSFDEVD
jgi:hypothetical protein